jgi:hypothetical protein
MMRRMQFIPVLRVNSIADVGSGSMLQPIDPPRHPRFPVPPPVPKKHSLGSALPPSFHNAPILRLSSDAMKFQSIARYALLLALIFGKTTADTPPPGSRTPARAAVDDLLDHWWIGDTKTGHLMPTHGGCEAKGRGVIWERGVLICALEGLGTATGDADCRERVRAQWLHDTQLYKPAELEACGPGSPAPWCDDATWALLYYVTAFQQTGDPTALDRAKGMIRNIRARWHDDALDGGLWYNEQRKVKSLYSIAFVYGCLGVYGETGEHAWLDIALEEYNWIESHLLRADGLYWCDFSAGPPANPEHQRGPVGTNRAGHIAAASSVVYLGGNMGMGACQAYLWQLTGEDKWRTASLRTADALVAHLTNRSGCFINDRDAFTNGIFASFWARRMVGIAGTEHKCFAVLSATAERIAAHRTTADYHPAYGMGGAGFYTADWDGSGVWEEKGSMANMMHVSASSACFIVAASYATRGR